MKKIEFLVGLFVLIALSFLLIISLQFSDLSEKLDREKSFKVAIAFNNIGGLKVGSKVSIAGVKVGEVIDIQLDQYLNAKVTLVIYQKYNNIPADSFVQISTSGLLGEQYISVDAASGGFIDKYWHDGYQIDKQYGSSALSLEKIISKFLYSGDKK